MYGSLKNEWKHTGNNKHAHGGKSEARLTGMAGEEIEEKPLKHTFKYVSPKEKSNTPQVTFVDQLVWSHHFHPSYGL